MSSEDKEKRTKQENKDETDEEKSRVISKGYDAAPKLRPERKFP